MKRTATWYKKLDERTANALFMTIASVCIITLLSGVASVIATQSRQPPFEYIFRRGDEAVSSAKNVIQLDSITACAGQDVTVHGYRVRINLAPITVLWATTWREAQSGRSFGAGARPSYVNYPYAGDIIIDDITLHIPDGFQPGEYERVTSAWTAVTFPQMYVVKVRVRAC